MPDGRFPTQDEFWQRLEIREVESDLREALHARLGRENLGTPRLGAERGSVAVAVARRLLPSARVPGEALAAFLDWGFDRPLGRGDERAGALPTPELIPMGLDALADAAQRQHGKPFTELGDDEQDALLTEAERGHLTLPAGEAFDSTTWFKRTRAKLLLGYGSDPRGMVEMGFPGPSYKPGHVWLARGEIDARVARRPGYLWL